MDGFNLSTVFCDDIRREIGGKMTLVGVYGDYIVLDKLPARLKLHMAWYVDMPPDYVPEEIEITVYNGAEQVAQLTGKVNAEQSISPNERADGLEPINALRGEILISALEITDTSLIRATARIDEIELSGAKLGISAQH